jgi:carbamoyl-phosphate synthase large subunit
MTKILVTGAGALLGQGIVRALQGSSLDCEIVTADSFNLSAGLFWGVRGHVPPSPKDPRYIEALTELLRAERPDIVMVGTDTELPLIAQAREALEAASGGCVLVSSSKVVNIADDKYLTYEFFKEAGFFPPLSALPEDAAALDELIDTVGFPLIVKPRVGARSIGVSRVTNKNELRAALEGRSDLVVQECVGTDSEEYTAGVLVFDGRAEASIVMRRDLRDGNTHRAYLEPFPELNAEVRKFGEALKPFGPVNFQFRTDRDGRPRVFEINGRFSGTTPMRALVGFNEVEMCVRKILWGEPIAQPELREATVLRHWTEMTVSRDQFEGLKEW